MSSETPKHQNTKTPRNSVSYWSLYKKDEELCQNETFDSPIENSPTLENSKPLEPLKFSNQKTQGDIVKETLNEIEKGNKIIFIQGVCGSGKSAIALNLARHFKKTSIVVPIKTLQEQYEKDYSSSKFILKTDNKTPLKISLIKGRNNFRCPFLGECADNPELPCTIEIKEKNLDRLLEYIEKNPSTEKSDFSKTSDIRRMNIAPACPYWAPIMPSEINPKGLPDTKKIKYESIAGKEFALFSRRPGCPWTDQYNAYSNADVLIFNSMKYQIESQLGRKPKTDLDIIDECDEFLDSFSSERKLNIQRLINSLNNLTPKEQKNRLALKDLIHKLNLLQMNPPITDIQKITASPILEIIETILENPNLAEDEELNYYNTAVEIARSFKNLLKETYVSIQQPEIDKEQKSLFSKTPKHQNPETPVIVTLVSINLAQKLSELIEQNNVLVMMSGTLHSEKVLREIFGLKNFVTVVAEAKNPGKIIPKRTGAERNCSFQNFKDKTITRSQYLKILDMQVAKARPPTLVHVSAFKDLPSDSEANDLFLENIITQEKLIALQKTGNQAVKDFTNKELDILFTTKCSRGVDFPGEACNSIIITKFPYPNIQGLFWKILKQEQPDKFMQFYLDKARRELIQKVSRGVRFKGDSVDLWSPDVRVLNAKLE